MQKKARKVMIIFLCLVFVVFGSSISYATGINLALSSNTIVENSAIATEVGGLSIVDSNSTVTYTYSFVSGIGDTDNASFILAGNILKTNTAVDYETKNKYKIRIKAVGSDSSEVEKAFDITISNIIDAPTAYDKVYTSQTGTDISSKLCANDFESELLTYAITTAPLNGSVVITNVNTGEFTYTPASTASEAMTDSFMFSVSDGVYTSNIASATIKINIPVESSGLSLSIRPRSLNMNMSKGKSPILAVIKLDSGYTIEDVKLETLKLMINGIELDLTRTLSQISGYCDSNGATVIKAMFSRSSIPEFTPVDGEVSITASVELTDSTSTTTILQGSDDVKVNMPKATENIMNDKYDDKSFKDEFKNNIKDKTECIDKDENKYDRKNEDKTNNKYKNTNRTKNNDNNDNKMKSKNN